MILHHGTPCVFSEFAPGTFFTDSLSIAETYARYKAGYLTTPRVISVSVVPDRVVSVSFRDICTALGYEYDGSMPAYMTFSDLDALLRSWTRQSSADIIVLTDLRDMADNNGRFDYYPQYLVKDPRRITMIHEYEVTK